MSYQVLARKWRPTSFEEVSGQSHVTTALRNAIRSDRIPHAILLTGPRGVGKTTLARLLARALNCEKGPTPEPCGTCPFCTDIAEGRSTDVQEIDAASRTSVDDVREIIESIRYAPTPGKWRIYVVDEVHMLSAAAFNALLKTLEEPPPRSLFVFATTNPEKIPYTVVSRCQRHDLRRLAAGEVIARLAEIASAEELTISESALLQIARAGEGSLRDALTLLDQVIAVAGDRAADEQVAEILDLIDAQVLLGIAEACVDGDPAAALTAAGRAAERGIDAKRLGAALVRVFRDLVVLRVAPESQELVDASDAEREALLAVAERAEPARLRRMFRALVQEQEDLTWAPEPFAVLEMGLVRIATLPGGDEVGELVRRLQALEGRLQGVGPEDDPGAAGSGGGGGKSERGDRGAGSRKGSRPEPKPEAGAVEAATPDRSAPPEAAAPEAAAPEAAGDEAVYDRLRVLAQQENRGLFAALEGGRIVERAPGRLALELPPGIGARRLAQRKDDLAAICARVFGRPTEVEVSLRDDPERGAARGREDAEEGARARRREALSHPAINTALEVLGGEIVEIRPLAAAPRGQGPGPGGSDA